MKTKYLVLLRSVIGTRPSFYPLLAYAFRFDRVVRQIRIIFSPETLEKKSQGRTGRKRPAGVKSLYAQDMLRHIACPTLPRSRKWEFLLSARENHLSQASTPAAYHKCTQQEKNTNAPRFLRIAHGAAQKTAWVWKLSSSLKSTIHHPTAKGSRPSIVCDYRLHH